MVIEELAQKVIRTAGREAAQACLAIRSDAHSGFTYKADRDPVSIADYSSQAIILHHILTHFPEDSVLTEETVTDFESILTDEQQRSIKQYVGNILKKSVTIDEIKHWFSYRPKQPNGRTWIIDPVDGTRGFFKGDQFAIAIALVVDDRTVLSVLVCPLMPFNSEVTGVMAIAQKDRGAVLESLNGDSSRVLSVSKQGELKSMCFALGNVRHRDRKVVDRLFATQQIGGTIVQISSQAKYVAIADGRADLFFRFATEADESEKVWDHVAGELIIRETGGCVTDLDGKQLNFFTGRFLAENKGILVTNGRLHQKILQVIRDLGQV